MNHSPANYLRSNFVDHGNPSMHHHLNQFHVVHLVNESVGSGILHLDVKKRL